MRTFFCMTHHESVDEKHESLFIAEKLGAFMPFLIFSVISFMGVLGSIFLPGTYHKVIFVVWYGFVMVTPTENVFEIRF